VGVSWQDDVKSVIADLNKSSKPEDQPTMMWWRGYMFYRDGRTPTGGNGEELSEDELADARERFKEFVRQFTITATPKAEPRKFGAVVGVEHKPDGSVTLTFEVT
jgi:hypothetical protein